MTGGRVRSCVLPLLALLVSEPAWAQVGIDLPETEPQVLSIFPLGARQGSTLEAEARGRNLEGAYAVWCDAPGLTGRVRGVEDLLLEDGPTPQTEAGKARHGQRVRLELAVDRAAPTGLYSLRVLTPRGISNALALVVGSVPVTAEAAAPHDRPELAQPVTIPAVVNGRIGRQGEVDYYAFEAVQGQELVFEVFAKPPPATLAGPRGFDAQLAIYELSGSWFDPHRAKRLAFNDEPVTKEHRQSSEFLATNPRLVYGFATRGRWLVQVASALGSGDPDCPYQLRITPAASSGAHAKEKDLLRLSSSSWRERAYDRALQPDRLERLAARAAGPAQGAGASETAGATGGFSPLSSAGRIPRKSAGAEPAVAEPVRQVLERAPDGGPPQAPGVSVPSVIEGTIDRPGDVDHFLLDVEEGQALAFEFEAPRVGPPVFNPWLRILDGEGREVFTNLYRRIGRAFTFYLKTVEPKTTCRFTRGGRYTIEIRDLSSRHGSPEFEYRLLVRRQIPHVGEIEVCWECPKKLGNVEKKIPVDRINLTRGQARTLTVHAELEEGFGGSVAVRVEGLPRGVEAVAGTEPATEPGSSIDEGEDKAQFVPRATRASVVLLAADDAPQTSFPQLIRITARPVEAGRIGQPLEVREIPLMVVGSAPTPGRESR